MSAFTCPFGWENDEGDDGHKSQVGLSVPRRYQDCKRDQLSIQYLRENPPQMEQRISEKRHRWAQTEINQATEKQTLHFNRVRRRILRLKQKYPSWGARRLKHQFNLPVSWRTVHRIIKRNCLLVRIKAKPQPCKRFQRKHVDSMWQGDTFQFRIKGAGKVYLTGFTDDRFRFRVRSKAYLRKGKEEAVNALRWALKAKRKPRQIYLDNGRQFTSKLFKADAAKHGIKLIFGKPYNPRGRGKIERYHRALYQEEICIKHFKSLSHFRRELWKFDRRYNYWRKQEALGWLTPASIYNDQKYFNKGCGEYKKRTNVLSTK